MRGDRWCWGHQVGRESGITWYSRVRVHVHCGLIVSIESVSPTGAWSPRDYYGLPDVSELRVGDQAPQELISKSRNWERFSATMRNRG